MKRIYITILVLIVVLFLWNALQEITLNRHEEALLSHIEIIVAQAEFDAAVAELLVLKSRPTKDEVYGLSLPKPKFYPSQGGTLYYNGHGRPIN